VLAVVVAHTLYRTRYCRLKDASKNNYLRANVSCSAQPTLPGLVEPRICPKEYEMRFFVAGASGFIGGSFAADAVRRGHQVRGLIRSANKTEACGIVPVHGMLGDHDLLADEASAADAVINDDRDAVDVLLKALAGSEKALLHASGSSIVADHANGEPSEAVFSEAVFDEDHMPTPTADKAARVALDQAILSAPGLRSVVLCNALVLGDALGPKARSIQLPLLIDQARGKRASPLYRSWPEPLVDRSTLPMWWTSICSRWIRRQLGRLCSWKLEKPHSAIWRRPSPTRWS
jgi:hypothetical protein